MNSVGFCLVLHRVEKILNDTDDARLSFVRHSSVVRKPPTLPWPEPLMQEKALNLRFS